MAEKVKVSREVAKAIDFVINVAEIQFKDVMGIMLEGGFSRPENKKAFPLNNLPLKQIAAILINGYEIEETPEEKLLGIYNLTWHEYNRITNFQEKHGGEFENGFAKGIEKAIETLGIKIKGINE
ncbi:MAG: hypothetical protein ABS882_01365 [Lysinibacillus sp.]